MDLYCSFAAALTQRAVQVNTLLMWAATEQHKGSNELPEIGSKQVIS